MENNTKSLETHVKAWKQIQVAYSQDDIDDLERIYKCKAPKWVIDGITKEE